MFTFFASAGRLGIEGTPFDRGRADFQFDDGRYRSDALKWRKVPGGFVAETEDIEFRVRTGRARFSVAVRNRGHRDRFLRSVQLVFAPQELKRAPQADEYLEFIHPFGLGVQPGVKKVGLAGRSLESNPESSMVYVLRRIETGEAVLFSALPPHRGDFLHFRALHEAPHHEGRFGLCITSVQDRLLRAGAEARTSDIQTRTGPDATALLEQLGTQWQQALRRPLKPVARGWNSWDYYSGAVTSRNIFDNMRAARKQFSKRLPYIVIDEGWEPRWGEWVANGKFPEGTRGYCRRVKAAGCRPGIWLAPLMVNHYTDLYRDHPDWFLRDANGQIVKKLYAYGPMSHLDITHPKVGEWIHAIFSRLREDGFEYFKCDFTQESLTADLWHDRTVPRGMLLRRLFETIRRAIGPDAYLLACGAPYESVLGVVDAVRITGDIHTFWSHIVVNASGIATRAWMHRKACNVDPDFLVVRCKETCSLPRMNREHTPVPFNVRDGEFWLAGREMNLREARAYALLVYLSAGDTILGDVIMSLNKTGLDILHKVFERPLTRPATPVDLFSGHDALPAFWLAEEKDGWFLGVFNWTEDPAAIQIALPGLGIRSWSRIESFWSERTIQAESGAFALDMPPRSAEGFRITR